MTDEKLRLIFDQYSRYRAVAEIVTAIRDDADARILDVGSGELGLLGAFLPGADITYVDPLLDTTENRDDHHIGGDIFTSKLDGSTFDYLVSVDTLEHVPGDSRRAFLDRVSSLSEKGFVLAFPCSDAGDAIATDNYIAKQYRDNFGSEYSWLDEHFRFKLPSLDETVDRIRHLGWQCEVIGHGYTPWLRELLGFVVCAWDVPAAQEIVRNASERFNRELYTYDFNPPFYRQILIATKTSLDFSSVNQWPAISEEAQAIFDDIMAAAYRQLLPVVARMRKSVMAHDNHFAVDLTSGETPIEEWTVESANLARLAAVRERDAAYVEKGNALRERDGAIEQRDVALSELDAQRARLVKIHQSLSWRITAPMRLTMRMVRYGPQPSDKAKLTGVARQLYRRLPLPFFLKGWLRRVYARTFGDPNARSSALRFRCQTGNQFAAPISAAVSLASQTHSLPDYIIFGVIDWHFRTQRPQHLARELGVTGRRVFYVSNLFEHDQEPGFSIEPLDGEGRLFQIRLNLGSESSIYSGAPGIQEIAQLRSSMGELLLWTESKSLVGFVQHPYWFDLASVLPNARVVYDCMDHHEGFDNTGAELLDLERTLAMQADLLVVTSSMLDDSWSDLNANRAVIRNAGDFDRFSKSPENCYRDEQGRKVIGYYGAIAEWFDLKLVEAIASRFPDCQLLLIGSDTTNAKRALDRLNNVTFLGEVPYERLPYYLHGFDVCILPFKVVPLTLATNPVKVYEYLSAGKPVVTVNLPEMAQFSGLVQVADSHEDFLTELEGALARSDDEAKQLERKRYAADQTWTHRVSDLISHVESSVDEPTVSIIVVTYNNLELNKACLESLDQNNCYDHAEIIVVDNASSDGTPELLQGWADGARRSVILNKENKGFAAANNQGLAAASGDYLIMLNNDTYVTPGWIRSLLNYLRRDPTIGIIGPVTNNIGNEARIDIKYESMDEMMTMAARYTRRNLGKLFTLRTAAFFCVMLPRAVYEKVGPLDEAFGVGWFEDDDYCRRVEKEGWRVVCAEDVFIHHHHSATFDKLKHAEREALFAKNKAIYEEKWGEWIPHTYR